MSSGAFAMGGSLQSMNSWNLSRRNCCWVSSLESFGRSEQRLHGSGGGGFLSGFLHASFWVVGELMALAVVASSSTAATVSIPGALSGRDHRRDIATPSGREWTAAENRTGTARRRGGARQWRHVAPARGGPARGLSLIHISEPTRLLSISYAVFCLK